MHPSDQNGLVSGFFQVADKVTLSRIVGKVESPSDVHDKAMDTVLVRISAGKQGRPCRAAEGRRTEMV